MFTSSCLAKWESWLRASLSLRPSALQIRPLAIPRSFSTTIRRTNDVNVFHSLKEGPAAEFLSAYQTSTLIPQTLTEKIVQKYAAGVAKDKVLKSRDYVTLQPHRHMIIHGQ